MEDKPPVVSAFKLGREHLLMVKIDPEFEDPAGQYTLDIQIEPRRWARGEVRLASAPQFLGSEAACTVLVTCPRCTKLNLTPI